jgi:hypothetical protein
MLKFWDGTRMNSQVRIQYEINMHTQTKKAINVSWTQVVQ